MRKIKLLIAAIACTAAFNASAQVGFNSAPLGGISYDYPTPVQMMMMQKMSPEAQKKPMEILKKMDEMKMNHQMEVMKMNMRFQEQMMKMQQDYVNSLYFG